MYGTDVTFFARYTSSSAHSVKSRIPIWNEEVEARKAKKWRYEATFGLLPRVGWVLSVGESKKADLKVQFHGRIGLQFHGAKAGIGAHRDAVSGQRREQVLADRRCFHRAETYQHVEKQGFRYAIRLPGNPVLHRQIEALLTRPPAGELRQMVVHYHDLQYRAANWGYPRRVVAPA